MESIKLWDKLAIQGKGEGRNQYNQVSGRGNWVDGGCVHGHREDKRGKHFDVGLENDGSNFKHVYMKKLQDMQSVDIK